MISSRLSTAWGFSILAMTGSRTPYLVHDRVDVVEVRGRPHEGQRDHVGPQPQRPAQVVLVLLGQGRHGDGDAGQVDALVVGDRAAHR